MLSILSLEKKDYLTASLSAFAARNRGTRAAATFTGSPVLGLRAVRAARVFTEKIPRPAIDTSSPFLSVLVIPLMRLSMTSSACTLVPPTMPCTSSTSAALFIVIVCDPKGVFWNMSDNLVRACKQGALRYYHYIARVFGCKIDKMIYILYTVYELNPFFMNFVSLMIISFCVGVILTMTPIAIVLYRKSKTLKKEIEKQKKPSTGGLCFFILFLRLCRKCTRNHQEVRDRSHTFLILLHFL